MTETNYPLTNLEEKVNGKDLRIVGVEHIPEFFEEHKEFFEKIKSNTDYAILETPTDRASWENKFYGCIANLYLKKGHIYEIDPVNLHLYSLRTIENKNLLDLFLLSLRYIRYIKDAWLLKKRLDKKFNHYDGNFDCSSKNSYSSEFRNIVVAESLDRLTRVVDGKGVLIFGDDHFNHPKCILNYLRNPDLRNKRKQMYCDIAYFKDLYSQSETKIREYKPTDATRSGWEKVREF